MLRQQRARRSFFTWGHPLFTQQENDCLAPATPAVHVQHQPIAARTQKRPHPATPTREMRRPHPWAQLALLVRQAPQQAPRRYCGVSAGGSPPGLRFLVVQSLRSLPVSGSVTPRAACGAAAARACPGAPTRPVRSGGRAQPRPGLRSFASPSP